MWLGLPQLALFPFVPFILKHVDSLVVCATGILLFAASCIVNGTTITHDTGTEQLRRTQLLRAIGQPLLMQTARADDDGRNRVPLNGC